MSSINNSLLVLGTVLFALAGHSVADMPRFEAFQIGDVGSNMGQTSLVDIDRDGDLDWVVGQAGRMWWFEYVRADQWIQHDMGHGAKTDVGGCAFDIDGDGWVDQVSGTGWYRNTGKPRTEEFEAYSNGAISCHDNVAADIDGDGRLDVAACSNAKGQVMIAWYRIPDDPKQKWIEHRIGEGIHGGVDPRGVSDLDGDGDSDVVRGDVWFENADGKGTRWQEHPSLTPWGGSRPDRFGLAIKTWICDLDGDGDNDLVQAEADTVDGRVFWFENRRQGQEWLYHSISAEHTRQDFHSLAVADFDNDGDLDAFSGGGPLSQSTHRCFVWENIDGKGRAWKEHVVLEGKRCHEAKAADVDGDGDIDICFKPWRGSLHMYLRNMFIEDERMKESARDLARIAYCMLSDGRWREKQVIPRWFVEETAAPTHGVTEPELRFNRAAESFSHGWELPSRLTIGEATASRRTPVSNPAPAAN